MLIDHKTDLDELAAFMGSGATAQNAQCMLARLLTDGYGGRDANDIPPGEWLATRARIQQAPALWRVEGGQARPASADEAADGVDAVLVLAPHKDVALAAAERYEMGDLMPQRARFGDREVWAVHA